MGEMAGFDSNCSARAIVNLTVQMITLILNIFAAIVLWSLKDYRTNISHLIVRFLVVSDVFSSVTSIIPTVVSCTGTKLRSRTFCTIFGYFSSAFLLWTAFIVLLMCTLRYLALAKPLYYRTKLDYNTVRYVLAGELIWSCMHLSLPLFGVGRFKFYPDGEYCAFEIQPCSRKDAILVHIIVWEGWLTMLLLTFFSIIMLRNLIARKRRASRMSFQQQRGFQATSTRQHGYTMMTIVIVAVYMACFIPFVTYRMLALIKKQVNEKYHYHLHLIANFSLLVNPVIYVAFNKVYNKAAKRMLNKICCCFVDSIRKISQSSSISLGLFSTSSDENTQNAPNKNIASASITCLITSFQSLDANRINGNSESIVSKDERCHDRISSDNASDTASVLPKDITVTESLSTKSVTSSTNEAFESDICTSHISQTRL